MATYTFTTPTRAYVIATERRGEFAWHAEASNDDGYEDEHDDESEREAVATLVMRIVRDESVAWRTRGDAR